MKAIELCDKVDCTGCAACVNSCKSKAISMQRDEDGFNYPIINRERCIECGLCQNNCPILNHPKLLRRTEPVVYAAWSLDEAVRTSSSSGGMFAELARATIESGGVVFGAAFDGNFHLAHIGVDTMEGLEKLKGSKYLQSEVGDTLLTVRKLLRAGRMVMFSGTPCQVAGLRSFLHTDYDNLLTVDIVCHGVPSPTLFEKYRRKLMESYGVQRMDSFSFRDTSGWRLEFSFTSEGVRQPIPLDSVNILYPRAFLKDFMSRESCYRCAFARIPRQGDITIADFWGIGDLKLPKEQGVSLVLVNSEHGDKVFKNIENRLFHERRELSEALPKNHNLVEPTHRPDGRDTFYRDFDSMDFAQVMERYNLTPKNKGYKN